MAPWPYFLGSILLPYFLGAVAACGRADGAIMGTASAGVVKYLELFRRPSLRPLPETLVHLGDFVVAPLQQRFLRLIHGQLGIWDMVQLLAACTLLQALRLWKNRRQIAGQRDLKDSTASCHEGRHSHESVRGSHNAAEEASASDAMSTDPGLLKKHSTNKSYTTSSATYPSIRTFLRPHPQADKLPNKPTPLPLLVFIHGLGGSLAQFHPLLTSLVNVAPCLGIDLPGCGLSEFSPTTWCSYSTAALVELLSVVIDQHYDRDGHQGVVLIGHSMGCSLSTLIASTKSPVVKRHSFDVLGIVAICPRASPPSEKQIATYRKLLQIPTPIFDLWRRWDRRGGPESVSVSRFVGSDADIETKKLQERFNEQSRTAVWRRMAWGALPVLDASGNPLGGLPGPEVWANILVPLFLVAGEADNITKPEEVETIGRLLGKLNKPNLRSFPDGNNALPQSAAPAVDITKREPLGHSNHDEKFGLGKSNTETTLLEGKVTTTLEGCNGSGQSSKNHQVLKTSILPAPASHALLYDHDTYHTLAGLIQAFLADHIDSRLSLGWQLQHLSTEGKWDVKNLAKWQAFRPVSEPIAGIFRALKTLREIDDTHSPAVFVRNWKGKIKAVIDISHESPVYDPKGLEQGGIEYHKFPTVSKVPPTVDEVKDFISLVDRLRGVPSLPDSSESEPLIGVHCHYGFNRTGFFICCYLIEKEGYGVQRAIDEFKAQRYPGIRHDHFISTLFVRYCTGLKRAPTF
ncbi:MAG: dual specificity phosphatase catalytic domain [Lasallia pustulata]|uniref:Dual specificity phosphatase catalytic domain n=1 Tax=Lasallia pustulata TaxID=136370 RepID=A0A5M8Q251_9LECA|nr:MAG: dual specificity phosphatase catalytic domain [Lasallia pustulata]